MAGMGPGGGGGDVIFGGRVARGSSNAYANGSNQNVGNGLADTPTTRVAKPPGGASSISLGWDEPAPNRAPQRAPDRFNGGYDTGPPAAAPYQGYDAGPPAAAPYPGGGYEGREMLHGARPDRVSGNAFAQGHDQNCGNVMTDYPSTRVAAPPGGASSLSLAFDQEQPGGRPRAPPPTAERQQQQGRSGYGGGGYSGGDRGGGDYGGGGGYGGPTFGERPRASSNSFANGSNQNCGNVMTDRSSTRVRAAPGGNSSFTLG